MTDSDPDRPTDDHSDPLTEAQTGEPAEAQTDSTADAGNQFDNQSPASVPDGPGVADGGGTTEAAPNDAMQSSDADGESARSRLIRVVYWTALAVLCLLALVATFRFYFAASEAIRVWFSSRFVAIFQAVFNVLVLIASLIGISVVVRRMR